MKLVDSGMDSVRLTSLKYMNKVWAFDRGSTLASTKLDDDLFCPLYNRLQKQIHDIVAKNIRETLMRGV